MAKDFYKIQKGLSIAPRQSPLDPQNGDIWYDQSLQQFQKRQDGVTSEIVGTQDPQTLYQKAVGDALRFVELTAAPATPSAGSRLIYAKNDGKFYQKGSDGLEKAVGSGSGSGGVNFIGLSSSWSPDFTDDRDAEGSVGQWAAYKDAPGTSPVDALNNIPVDGAPSVTITRSTANKLNGSASFLLSVPAGATRQGEGVSVPFYVPEAYRGKKVCIKFPFKVVSGSIVEDDFITSVVDVTGTPQLQPVSHIGKLAGSSRTVLAYFDVPTNMTQGRLAIHVARASNTGQVDIAFDDVEIGLNNVAYGDVVNEEYVSNSNSTSTASDTASFVTGVGSNIPNGATGTTYARRVRFARPITVNDRLQVELDPANTGQWIPVEHLFPGQRENGIDYGIRFGQVAGTTDVDVFFGIGGARPTSATYGVYGAPWSSFTAYKWRVVRRTVVRNVQMAESAVEYAYNTSTADNSDTTSFGYGPEGVAIGSFTTAERVKRVRFTRPVGPTNHVKLQHKVNGVWMDAANSYLNWETQGAARYGMRIAPVSGSSTDFDVFFAVSGAFASGAYGAAGAVWSSVTNVSWRLVKSENANFVGAESKVVVSASVTNSSAISTNTTAVIPFSAVDSTSTHSGSFTTGAAAKFTAPRADFYRVSVIGGTNVSADTGYVRLQIRKNGTNFGLPVASQSSTTIQTMPSISKTIWLNAGDTLDATLAYAQGVNQTVSAEIYIESVN